MDRQPDAGPRGPPHEGAIGFHPFRFHRIAQNQASTQAAQTQRTSGHPVVQSDRNINTADTQRLDKERSDYVAQQQALRNMAPAYSQLPLAATPHWHPPIPALTQPPLLVPAVSLSHSAPPPATPSFSRARVIPLPHTRLVKGRTGDISKYYSTQGSRYTGRASDRHSLARHQVVLYAQAHICELNAQEALQCLIMLIEPQSLAGSFYVRDIFQKVSTLEEAFDKVYQWDRHSSNLGETLREWRSLEFVFQNRSHGPMPWRNFTNGQAYCRINLMMFTSTRVYS